MSESVKGDLISREALLEHLKDWRKNWEENEDSHEKAWTLTAIDYFMSLVDVKAPTAYNDGWIPCSERLPEEKGAVLVTYENVNDEVRVEVTMYEPKRKSFWVSPNVLAWMPLPEAYKPEKGV